ncbi:class I SAM-dependent methyltransferase [Chaetoceros tenuissimus]|uniref:Class I SAM-dependent methyltransferase n=1 Tax=Chaetoceros tenuissimus TaxID=426638 RepID=A0AAD3HDD6_9STRA|nr:class I SAM-dependent methyltransferase [Chaetoceros tenuissimus]
MAPLNEDKSVASFWDRMADGYFKQKISDEESYKTKLELTRSYFHTHTNVLEFGCGTGGTALLHAPYVKHILATDISPRMIEIAKKQALEKKIENVDFECGSVGSIGIPKQSKDVVLGLSILHLVKDRKEVMEKTYEWLKPGGVFVTSTVCINDMTMGPIFKMIVPIAQFFGVAPPVFALSRDVLVEEMKSTGFVIEKEWRPLKKNGKADQSKALFLIAKKQE